MTVPSWIKDAVFYQIFPDRFASGDQNNQPANCQPWGSTPTRHGFQGGDLKGITDHLDYLLNLGINAIYLNPIFLSPSTHRYDTVDYYRIDPKLGTLDDFHQLIKTAHQNGVRVILDGVFNHCARGFFAFSDLLENGEESPYRSWFHVSRFPLRAYEPGKARNYAAWWGFKSLPKFNTEEPAVRRYLLGVARYWIEQGADGWRLDVPNEIDDDAFWAEFRQVVCQANPEAYLLGEIWEALPRWVNDTHFDGLMNYPMRSAVLSYLNGTITSALFAERVEGLLGLYPRENVYAMYNLLGSHDTERVLTMFGGNVDKVKLAFLFAFAYPGVPAIYYGDEIGLAGGRDPDCRGAFLWDQKAWNQRLREWVQALIAVRKASPALKEGDFRRLLAQEKPECYAFARMAGNETVIVAINASAENVHLNIPVEGLGMKEGQALQSLMGKETAVVKNGHFHVHLAPCSGDYLK